MTTGRLVRVAAALAAVSLLAACGPAAAPGTTGRTSASPNQQTGAPGTAGAVSLSPSTTPSAMGGTVGKWSPLKPEGSIPAAREDHTWTVDASGRYAYLFGGRDGARVFDDLWRYELASNRWRHLSPSGSAPAGRFGHTGTWVEGRGLVVWSGQAGAKFFSDLWSFEPEQNRWARLRATGAVPPARYGSCASLGPDGRLWISHGFTQDTGRFSDTRAYDFTTGRWSDETPRDEVPVIRCLHDCLWTPDGQLLLYGGQTTGVRAIGDLWALEASGNMAGWTREPMPPLPARNLYAAAALDGQAFVFGGVPPDGPRLADLWRLDLHSLAWTGAKPGAGPAGRSGAALVADPTRDRLVLFGGLTESGAVRDTWELLVAR